MVGVAVHDLPALAPGAVLADADLVLDRGFPLQVRGITRVDRNPCHVGSRVSGLLAFARLARNFPEILFRRLSSQEPGQRPKARIPLQLDLRRSSLILIRIVCYPIS